MRRKTGGNPGSFRTPTVREGLLGRTLSQLKKLRSDDKVAAAPRGGRRTVIVVSTATSAAGGGRYSQFFNRLLRGCVRMSGDRSPDGSCSAVQGVIKSTKTVPLGLAGPIGVEGPVRYHVSRWFIRSGIRAPQVPGRTARRNLHRHEILSLTERYDLCPTRRK